MSNQKVEWLQLDQIGTEIVNYADKEIAEQLKTLLDLKSKVNWEGADSDAVMKEFSGLVKELEVLVAANKQYGGFLRGVAEQYKQTSGKIQNSFTAERW